MKPGNRLVNFVASDIRSPRLRHRRRQYCRVLQRTSGQHGFRATVLGEETNLRTHFPPEASIVGLDSPDGIRDGTVAVT